MPMSIPWVQLHRVDQWKESVEHFGVKGEGDLELEIKPFSAFGEKPAIVSVDV